MFRLNYGNGQISGTYTSRKEAVREISEQRRFDALCNQPCYPIYLQTYIGDGEWRTVAKH